LQENEKWSKGIRINREWIDDPFVVKEEINKFIKLQFKGKETFELKLDRVPSSSLSLEDNTLLIAELLKMKLRG